MHRPSSDAAKDRHEHDELSQLRMHASGDAPANNLKLPRFSEAKEDEGYFCEPSVAKVRLAVVCYQYVQIYLHVSVFFSRCKLCHFLS